MVMSPASGTNYLHYPRLVIGRETVEVLGGTLQSLDFPTFERLDEDWARQGYFEATQSAFWVRSEPDDLVRSGESHLDAALIARGMLIYNALLAATGSLYPDPRPSARYWAGGGAVRRMLGPFERTWLLNAAGLEPPSREALDVVAGLAEQWHGYGFRHDHAVFSPLRGLATLASTFMGPASGMVPMVVALEGFLLPGRVRGIARNLAAATEGLLGEGGPGGPCGFHG